MIADSRYFYVDAPLTMYCMNDPDTVIRKIENVEIQGATAVARAGIELLQSLQEDGAHQQRLDAVAERLKGARPTEPLLFNAIDIALATDDFDQVLEHIDTAQDQIQETAADLIADGSVVFTHCHSSTVTGTLRYAFRDRGTAFTVHNTETRPLYQGRETAEELADTGIPVQHYVDAGGRIALKDADVMLIGADAITDSGHVLNKIGSELFAEVAQEHDVPVYVLADSWKFDHRTVFDYEPELEQRVAEEVWQDAPDGVEIVNYAFERIEPHRIDGIISDIGSYGPNAFVEHADRNYHELTGTEQE